MQASEILRVVKSAGGSLWVNGDSLGFRLPESESSLVPVLRTFKCELLELLRQRPHIPTGIHLVRWEPLPAPVRLYPWLTVLDIETFIHATLAQLASQLRGNDTMAGNWSREELLTRLEAVGITVRLG